MADHRLIGSRSQAGWATAEYPRREIVNAILYQARNGGVWRTLPHDLPPYRIVDTLRLIWPLMITPASVQDAEGAKAALTEFRRHVKFPKVIWVDAAYPAVVSWAWILWVWTLEVVVGPRDKKRSNVRRATEAVDCGVHLRMAQSFASSAKDFEQTVESSKAFVQVSMIHLMVRRL